MDVELDNKTGILPLRRYIVGLALLVAIAGIAIPLSGAMGTKMGLWSWTTGLSKMTVGWAPNILKAGAALGGIALVLSLVIAPRKRRYIFSAALAILISAGALFYGASKRNHLSSVPPIHDITTDTQNPPMFTSAIMDARKLTQASNSTDYVGKTYNRRVITEKDGEPVAETITTLVSVAQTRAYPDIRSLALDDSPSVVFGKALAAAQAQGWKIVTKDEAGGIIEATATTFWYGFKDDVVIRISKGAGGETILDARSVSRVGQSDLGANAKRLRAFLGEVQ